MLNVLAAGCFNYYQYLRDKLLIDHRCAKTFLSYWLYWQ